ncbi:MAG: hypothetical protein V2A69_01100 [Pseudomonadota bacterium]
MTLKELNLKKSYDSDRDDILNESIFLGPPVFLGKRPRDSFFSNFFVNPSCLSGLPMLQASDSPLAGTASR